MDVNLSTLSSLSKYMEKQKKLKKLYTKLPHNYISPFQRKKVIESYCYLNKDGTRSEDIKHKMHEEFLLSQFIKKLSRTNKEIEKERYDYLKRLKYYNGDNEESIKLKKQQRIENVLINKKLENLLDLRKYKLKFEKKRKEIGKKDSIIDNNNNNNNNNNNSYNERNFFKQKVNKNAINRFNISSTNEKGDENDIINKTRNTNDNGNIKNKIRNNYTNYLFNHSTSTYFSLNNKIKLNNDIKYKNQSAIKLNIKKEDNKDLEKKYKIIKKIDLYEKKWNLPKCLSFNKNLGRNTFNGNSIRFKKVEEFRNYNPKYDYIFPNTNKNIVFYGNKGKYNIKNYKLISTRKALCKYINNNYSFDDTYNIMKIINSEKEKKRLKKIEGLRNVSSQLNEYLNEKNKIKEIE